MFRADAVQHAFVLRVAKTAQRIPAEYRLHRLPPTGPRVVQDESRRPLYLPPTRVVHILRKSQSGGALSCLLWQLP